MGNAGPQLPGTPIFKENLEIQIFLCWKRFKIFQNIVQAKQSTWINWFLCRGYQCAITLLDVSHLLARQRAFGTLRANVGRTMNLSANYIKHFSRKSIFLLSRRTTTKHTGRCQHLFSGSSPRPQTQAALLSLKVFQPQVLFIV